MTDDWRAGLDDRDAALLDGYQRGVPVREEPFAAIADDLGTDAADVLDRVRSHVESGLVRRFGPVLNPAAIGSSTLAALSVPDEEVDEVAAIVNEFPEVSHNYRRDHAWNVWFVLTAASRERRDAILDEIESRSGYRPLDLPKRATYCTDLQFPIVDADGRDGGESIDSPPGAEERLADRNTERAALTDLDRTILEAIQDGLPLSPTPYADVADAIGVDATTVVERIDDLLTNGYVKRIGLVIDHRAAGFRNNCMVVWQVPDEEVDAAGERAGDRPYVTKCYHRPRRPDRGWEYTLFTMIHGRDPTAVEGWLEELAAEDLPYPHERLETVERLKQTGTRYETLLGDSNS